MSIDAQVDDVIVNENGSGKLKLIDRPGGCAGQPSLSYDSAPDEVKALKGLNIWGGSHSIMLGEKKIANRKAYTFIEFVDNIAFKVALERYKKDVQNRRKQTFWMIERGKVDYPGNGPEFVKHWRALRLEEVPICSKVSFAYHDEMRNKFPYSSVLYDNEEYARFGLKSCNDCRQQGINTSGKINAIYAIYNYRLRKIIIEISDD